MKLILIIITLLFSFNAMAEAEIWKCETYMGKHLKGTHVYKIDARHNGDIFIRVDAKWKSKKNRKDVHEISSIKFDEINENIKLYYLYPGRHKVEGKGYGIRVPQYEIYDLILKTIIAFKEDGSELYNAKCKSN